MTDLERKLMLKIGIKQSELKPRQITIDDLIQSSAIQQLRICCLQLGIDPNEFIQDGE